MAEMWELWRCQHYADGSETPCNLSVYTVPGSPAPMCPFVPPKASVVQEHGSAWMESVGLFEVEVV
jgi:hypothetical protein